MIPEDVRLFTVEWLTGSGRHMRLSQTAEKRTAKQVLERGRKAAPVEIEPAWGAPPVGATLTPCR